MLRVRARTKTPTADVGDTQSVTVNVGTFRPVITGGQDGQAVVALSALAGNIITKKPDGIYATVEEPDDILGFIAALDAALD